MTEYERRQKELEEQLRKELRQLGEESAVIEEQLKREWYKTHARGLGRDGGPAEQLKALEMENIKKFIQIRRKYAALGLDLEARRAHREDADG